MKLHRLIAPALAATVVIASAGTTQAQPDDSQRLRGMEGRSFAVEVFLPDGTKLFDNCYTFAEGGVFLDPAVPLAGEWSQNSTGASTSYEATLLGGAIRQSGAITPARGGGVLQLTATTDVAPGIVGPDPLTVVSVGGEVASCLPA